MGACKALPRCTLFPIKSYTDHMEDLWDIARVAEYLGVSERTVYNRVRAGELPAIKIGRLWRVRPSELNAWLSARAARTPRWRRR